MTALIAVEGILRTDTKEPIPEGFKLFRTLVLSYRVVLSTTGETREIEHWLRTNYIFDYSEVLDNSHFYANQELRMRHLDIAKNSGGKVELLVDSDPEMCAQALALGVPTILFATPRYFRSARDIRPWGVITEEQARQKQIIAEKYASINTDGHRWE